MSVYALDAIDEGPADVKAIIAGVWRRIVAFVIDGLLLGAVTYLVTTLFERQLIELGEASRLVGLAIVLVYFTIADSRITGGQSVGKLLLEIAVVDRDGNAVSLARAALRTLILIVPLYANGIFVPPVGDFILDIAIGVALASIVVGWGAALVYLFLFNAATRQSLHDWLTGTFVVTAKTRALRVTARTPALQIVLASLVSAALVAVFASATLVPSTFSSEAEYARLTEMRDRIADDPRISGVAATTARHTVRDKTTTQLQVDVRVVAFNVSLRTILNATARTVLALNPDLLGRDVLVIVASRGFDIGVAGSWTREMDSGTADEWRRRLENASGNL